MAGPWPGEVVCVSLGDDQDDGGDSDDDDDGGGGGGGGDDDGGGGSGGGDGDDMTMMMVCLLPKKDWLSIKAGIILEGSELLYPTRGGRWTSLDASFARCFAIF